MIFAYDKLSFNEVLADLLTFWYNSYTLFMEFDLLKNEENQKKHGIDFEEAQKLWEKTHVIIPAKHVKGENRFAILGELRGKVYLGIFTQRDDNVRIISCHRADKKWEKTFYDFVKKTEK